MDSSTYSSVSQFPPLFCPSQVDDRSRRPADASAFFREKFEKKTGLPLLLAARLSQETRGFPSPSRNGFGFMRFLLKRKNKVRFTMRDNLPRHFFSVKGELQEVIDAGIAVIRFQQGRERESLQEGAFPICATGGECA